MAAPALRWAVLCGAGFALACAGLPRPRGLEEANTARSGVSVEGARAAAPQAFAYAEQLRSRAETAYATEDLAGAQILGEQAVVAYSRAVLLARRTRAEAQTAEAEQRLGQARSDLAVLAEQEQRIQAEAADLELKVKVATDAIPLTDPGPASSAERERARREAARSVLMEARLLCDSGRLIQPERAGLAAAFAELDRVSGKLADLNTPAPLDVAHRLRSACLRELTLSRRPSTLNHPAGGEVDALLNQLSKGDWRPFRDDRGVVVTLRGGFDDKGEPDPRLRQRFEELARVVKSHPQFPLLVVVHSGRPGTADRDQRRARALTDLLKNAGVARLDVQLSADAQPIFPSRRLDAAERNERVEIVFVAPSSG